MHFLCFWRPGNRLFLYPKSSEKVRGFSTDTRTSCCLGVGMRAQVRFSATETFTMVEADGQMVEGQMVMQPDIPPREQVCLCACPSAGPSALCPARVALRDYHSRVRALPPRVPLRRPPPLIPRVRNVCPCAAQWWTFRGRLDRGKDFDWQLTQMDIGGSDGSDPLSWIR